MASWSAAVLEELDQLTPEGRNGLYHRLRPEIRLREGGGYEITGSFGTSRPLSSSTFRHYIHSEPRFRALVTEGATQQVELVRA